MKVKIKNCLIVTVLVLISILSLSNVVFAENTDNGDDSFQLTLTSDATEVKAGETIYVDIRVKGDSVSSLKGIFNYPEDQFEEVTKSNFECADGFAALYNSTTKTFIIDFEDENDENEGYIFPENGIVATVALTANADVNITQDMYIMYLQNVVIDGYEETYFKEAKIYIIPPEEDDLYLTTDKYKIGNNDFTKYQRGDKYLTRVVPQTNIVELKNHLETNGTIAIYDKDGNEITNEETLIGTMMKIKVTKEGCTDINLEISVIGDISGDATVTAQDLAAMKQQILKEEELKGTQFMSADISDDEKISPQDLAAMVQMILKELIF